jgi:hypothetical protein
MSLVRVNIIRRYKEGWMEEEYYSFSPVDKVPKKAGNYKDKEIECWKWLDFFNYFDDQHAKKIGKKRWTTLKERNSRKKIIEQSCDFRGKDVFKAMIDWVFENYRDYPDWKDIHIGLVCGSHGWANMIADNAEKQLKHDQKWKK